MPGIMNVMEGMDVHDRQDDTAPEPNWADALAEWDATEPAELVRPPRSLVITYRYDGRFHATSPDITGFAVTGPTLDETRRLVRADLEDFLDGNVSLEELMPVPGPDLRV